MELCKELKMRRLLSGHTQSALSNMAGCSVSKISAIERGRVSITLDEFIRIMELMGYRVELLITKP